MRRCRVCDRIWRAATAAWRVPCTTAGEPVWVGGRSVLQPDIAGQGVLGRASNSGTPGRGILRQSVLRHSIRCPRGAVSVEAALIFPILILLVVGMMEFALLFFTFSTLQSATRDIARQVAVNFAQANSGQIESEVRARMPGWSQGAISVTVAESAPLDPGSNVITVRAALPASGATPINFLVNTIGDWNLVTEVQMKQELPFSAPEI